MTLWQLLRHISDSLAPLYGQREARAVAQEVLRGIKGWDKTQLAIRSNDPVSDYVEQRAAQVLQRLLRHEPVQYVFQTARFCGSDYRVTPATLIPRPETEGLVDLIVSQWRDRHDLRVLDLGTGSGCIAIALARALPFSHVTAVDISPQALAVARENASRLAKSSPLRFVQADILAPDIGALLLPDSDYDIIVSNPPYVALDERAQMLPNVLLYEPPSALFVPDDNPLLFYRAILSLARRVLAHGGSVYFEINPLFASELTSLASSFGFSCETLPDFCGKTRYLIAKL